MEISNQKIPEVLPYGEFLKMMKINRSTADRWRRKGIIKVYSLGSSSRLFVRYSEILESLEESALKPAA